MQAQVEVLQEAQQFKAPTLRKSTRERIEEAEKERQRAEQVRAAPACSAVPPFTLDISGRAWQLLQKLESAHTSHSVTDAWCRYL